MIANPNLNRRRFLAGVAGAGLSAATAADTHPPIVDCHIHLFDQTRPQGAPYSGGGTNTLPALPARYRKLAVPLGIVAAIEIDASNWVEDNLWVLQTIEKEPLMVGTAGNLQPEKPDFKDFLERFHKNKLFLGFRYGNLWGYDLVTQVANPAFIEGMKLTAQAGLTMDSANPRPDLVTALVKLKDKVPDVRIVLDHTAHLAPDPSSGSDPIGTERAEMEGHLRDLAKRPGVYFKLSELMKVDAKGAPVTNPAVYKPRLDYLMDLFGEDRVIFGSDWPNGDAVNHLDAVVKIVRDYFSTKSRAAQEKYFWRNSILAYRWVKREGKQPQS
jgi:predicted TIM-barrel fold metal-dependent hydrolase